LLQPYPFEDAWNLHHVDRTVRVQVIPLEHRLLKTVQSSAHAAYSSGNRLCAQYFKAPLVLSSLATHQNAPRSFHANRYVVLNLA
jgi:hypothetical protein